MGCIYVRLHEDLYVEPYTKRNILINVYLDVMFISIFYFLSSQINNYFFCIVALSNRLVVKHKMKPVWQFCAQWWVWVQSKLKGHRRVLLFWIWHIFIYDTRYWAENMFLKNWICNIYCRVTHSEVFSLFLMECAAFFDDFQLVLFALHLQS